MSRKNAPTVPDTEADAVLQALRANLSLLGELAARYQVSTRGEPAADRPALTTADAAHALLGPEMSALAHEQLRVVLLDRRNRVLGQRVVYQGNAYSAPVRAAEVFRPAVLENAAAVIIAHNHPSGDPTPSPEDAAVTRDLVQAGQLLGVELLDHLVIGGGRFVSLKDRGLMPGSTPGDSCAAAA